MVSVADIKAGLTIAAGSTGDDILIDEKIQQAIAYISAGTSLSQSASGENLFEVAQVSNRLFYLSVRSNDNQILQIIAYNTSNVATTLAASDYTAITSREYELISEDYYKVKVTYISNYIMRAINQLVKEVATYEYMREMKKTGMLNKANEGAGVVTISYVQPVDFYAEIDRKLDLLFLRY